MIDLFGHGRWRCPKVVHGGIGLTKTERLVNQFEPAHCDLDKSRLREFIWDFSFSNHSLLDVANEAFPWDAQDEFKLLLVAESEVQGRTVEERATLIIRDLKVSERTLWGMHTSGKMPRPIRIGRAVR
jgi:hypothetical protein